MPGFSTTPVEATYLAWINTRSTGIDDAVHFFEEAGVGLSDGAELGSQGFVRLNFGCRQALLNKPLENAKCPDERLRTIYAQNKSIRQCQKNLPIIAL